MRLSSPCILLPFVLLSGCMVGPDFSQPNVDVSAHYLTDGAAVTDGTAANPAWWQNFNDPALNALIADGTSHNLTLQIAGLRVLQARAQLAASVGELYPQSQGISGAYDYSRPSQAAPGHIPGAQSDFHIAQIGFSASWEIDFWGKYRRAIQANDAAFLGSTAAYNAALVSLTGNIAQAYLAIRTLQAQIQVASSNITVEAESLRIATIQYTAGQTSQLDVAQSQTQLSLTQASLPTLQAQLQQQKDALAVLLGTTPDKIDALLAGGNGIPRPPAGIALGIPKDLLRQRPDVQQAEYAAATQSALLGVAKAQLYPALSLSGSFGYESSNTPGANVGDLFKWSSRVVSFGPSVQIPIFNYGQLTNQVRAQDAVFEQSILNYQNVVLQAQQEAQDAISNYQQALQALAVLTTAAQSAQQSANLAMIQYKDGAADYTTVLSAEQAQLQVENSLAIAQGNVPQTLVAVYTALGGGWQVFQNQDVMPGAIKTEMAKRTNWGGLLNPPAHEPPATNAAQLQQTYVPNW
jgi:NodT family efflux transporter outer membrane factor (OMF) lipoprotein